MSIAHLANERVVVLNGNKLCEYIAFNVDNKISVEVNYDYTSEIVISFGGVIFSKSFANSHVAAEKICFVLVDLTKNHIKSQVVGVAESDPFDESQPGEAYFLD